MARIRSIKPEFWTSEQVVDCSPMARLLFIGLWNFADDAGVHPTNLKRIKMNVLPGDEIELSSIRRLIEELDGVGLIELYTVEDKEYLRVTGWDAHQKIEKPSYKYPNKIGVVPKRQNRSATVQETVDDRSPPDRSGVESNITERSGVVVDVADQGSTSTTGRDSERDANRRINDQARAVFEKLEPILNLAKPLPFAPIKGWVQAGFDPDLDIVPTISEVMAKRRAADPSWRPGSLNYFGDAIKKANADRVANARPAAASQSIAKPAFSGSDVEGRAKLLGVYAGLLKSGRNLPDITQSDVEEMLGCELITAEDAQRAGFAA